MKNWEVIDGEHIRKVMWINHEIEMKLYCNGEDDIDEEEIDEIKVEEMVEKILEKKEYWDTKCKDLFANEFVDWFNEEEWVKPEYAEIYYETKSIDEVEKKLLKIIGKEDTEKIMKNNFLTKRQQEVSDFYKWEMNCFFCKKKLKKGYAYDTIFV